VARIVKLHRHCFIGIVHEQEGISGLSTQRRINCGTARHYVAAQRLVAFTPMHLLPCLLPRELKCGFCRENEWRNAFQQKSGSPHPQPLPEADAFSPSPLKHMLERAFKGYSIVFEGSSIMPAGVS
jgi:hypothetical protein